MIVKPLTIKYIRKFKSFFDERLSEEVLIKRVEQYYNKLNESLRIVPDEEKYIEEADTIANLLVKKCTQKNSTKGSFSFKLFSGNRVTNKKIFF